MDLFCFGVLLDVEDEDEVEEAEDDESEDISFSGGAVVTIHDTRIMIYARNATSNAKILMRTILSGCMDNRRPQNGHFFDFLLTVALQYLHCFVFG